MGFLIAFLCISSISFVFSFNFDTDFPIVYSDPATFPPKPNSRASYFGYSVVLHSDFVKKEAWIQIGAPRGNTSTISSKEPGVVFRCFILGPCFFIDIDTTRNKPSEDFFQKSVKAKKDGAWIGGSMDIDENARRVVVCAHRWANNLVQDYWMLGSCYWSHLNDSATGKLIPLIDGKGIIEDEVAKTYVYYYGQGQAGFSVHMSNSKTEPELLLGAPGVYNWDGTTAIYKDGPDSTPVASKLVSRKPRQAKQSIAYTEFSDLNIGNAIITTNTASFGLFGYALTSGYFFKRDELLYVSGAPRSKTCIGQILLYKFADRFDQALDVKNARQGYQLGEYFGSALTAGDINQDGLDDLVVGAPFYTDSKYNEGRIFIFLGSSKGSLEAPRQNEIIVGKAIGGQFGTSVMFLGDLHWDGYADVAVGAPYEDEGSGVVYIYRGNALGLDSKPCQRLVGKSFVPNIKGFGISFSKPTDIDINSYKDLAIGAYLSGHVVLLRSKPVVTLQQSILSLTPQLDYNTKMFEIRACFWYTGFNVPKFINVTRHVVIDELLRRAYLPTEIPAVENITLYLGDIACRNISVFIKPDLTNRYDPITASISQELIQEQSKPKLLNVGESKQRNKRDKFCKICPVTNTYKSTKEQTIELSFALGCGDDKLCITKLNLESKFLNIGSDEKYILGSTDYLKLETTISNEGEKAYLTQLIVALPKSVYFRSIPTNCVEKNSSSVISCSVDNPLFENKQKTVTLDLDMKEINTEKYGDILNFTLTVLTSSENRNKNVFVKSLTIVREADIALTGKTSQQSYSYGNITYGRPNFTQIYQVEKLGASPIGEVSLTVQIPTHFYGVEMINFIQLYAPEGYHAGQPINCQSNVKYIVEESLDVMAHFSPNALNDIDQNTDTSENVVETTEYPLLKRSVRQTEPKSSELQANDNTTEFEYPSNRTFYINCSNSDILCSYVTCSIGPFKIKQNIAVLQIKMLFDVSSIAKLLDTKDIIIFSTDGKVTIKSPPNFVQSGDRPDAVRVSSLFVGETPEYEIESWIIIVAVIAGLLLVLLLIMGLVKAGFFQRTKKMELAALKEAENSAKPKVPTELCILDWQLSRLGSPALDLSYFFFTCTDKELRDEHYDNLIQEYYDSLSSFLRKLGSDPDKLFPFEVLQAHLKKFSAFGLYMAIVVLHVMASEVDEIPDIHSLTDLQDLGETFQYETKNIEKYYSRIRGVILDFVKFGYDF